ncbi:MAG: hypothetical protein KDA21_11830 [Phycisphaerales bacterium]|nr:hypothetical protein [Phycisphaerales bacterium]
MSRQGEIERSVAALFAALNPQTVSADGRVHRDRPDWIARIGDVRWGIELTAFRNNLDPEPARSHRPDEAAIESRVRAKAARVDDYRAPGTRRVGLIIHAEFGPRSCRIEDDVQAERLVGRAAAVHAELGEPFDAIWLLRNVRPGDGGRLWRVSGRQANEGS